MFSVDVASTFQGVESDGPTIFAAKYEPWLQETLSGFGNGIRRPDSERIILWCNYVTQGVMSARLNTFCLEQLTQLCHANPRTCTGIVLLPNRAGDLRSSPTKAAWNYVCCYSSFEVGKHVKLLRAKRLETRREDGDELDDDKI